MYSWIDAEIRKRAATEEVVNKRFVYFGNRPFGQRLCSVNDEATDPFHAMWDIKVVKGKQRGYGTNV